MIKNVPVVTLCGSTKFKDEFEKANKELTLQGYVVLSVGCFCHTDDMNKDKDSVLQISLDKIHKRKIDMSDAIYVINVGGYIGDSTMSEIRYAYETGKGVFYLEDHQTLIKQNHHTEMNNKKENFFVRLYHSFVNFYRKQDQMYKYCRNCCAQLEQEQVIDSTISVQTIYKCKDCGKTIIKHTLKQTSVIL